MFDLVLNNPLYLVGQSTSQPTSLFDKFNETSRVADFQPFLPNTPCAPPLHSPGHNFPRGIKRFSDISKEDQKETLGRQKQSFADVHRCS